MRRTQQTKKKIGTKQQKIQIIALVGVPLTPCTLTFTEKLWQRVWEKCLVTSSLVAFCNIWASEYTQLKESKTGYSSGLHQMLLAWIQAFRRSRNAIHKGTPFSWLHMNSFLGPEASCGRPGGGDGGGSAIILRVLGKMQPVAQLSAAAFIEIFDFLDLIVSPWGKKRGVPAGWVGSYELAVVASCM